METSFVDSQLFAVIISILLAAFLTWLGHWMMIKKEERLFEKERKAKDKEWRRHQTKAEKDKILDIYKNAISALTVFTASDFQTDRTILESEKKLSKTDREKRDREINKVIDWVSLLVLRHPEDVDLDVDLNLFSISPSTTAKSLRTRLIELIKKEDNFFLTEPNKELENNFTRKVRFEIDKDFVEEQLIKNAEPISKINEKEILIRDLSESQREKLVRFNYDSEHGLPKFINLKVPIFREESNKVNYTVQMWQAKLNPQKADILEVISSWEKDFDDALEKAEKQKKEFNS